MTENLNYAGASAAPAAAKTDVAGSGTVPGLVLGLLCLTVLVPVELGFNLGPLFFTWSKAMAVVVFPYLAVQFFTTVQIRAYDIFFLAHVVWVSFCLLLNYGLGAGPELAGTYFLNLFVFYTAARVCLRSPQVIRRVIMVMFILAAISAMAAIPEAIFKKRFIHDFSSAITGRYYLFSPMERLGMLRAASFFEHPILYGSYVATVFSLVWFSINSIGARLGAAVVIAVGTFFSLSSAPLLMLVVQITLLVVERLTRWLKARALIIMGCAIGLVAFLNVATGRGAFGVLAMFTLSPQTAWYRTAIWTHGIDDVMANPIFGFVVETWTRLSWMSVSVDNHWLYVAMRGGLPAPLFLFISFLLIWRAAKHRAQEGSALTQALVLGWGLTIVGIVLIGFTVAYFGRFEPLLAFFIGIGAALAGLPKEADAADEAQSAKAAAVDPARPPMRFSRFGPDNPPDGRVRPRQPPRQ